MVREAEPRRSFEGERIGLVVKPGSSMAEETAGRVVKVLESLGIEPVVSEETRSSYESLGKYRSFSLEEGPPEKVIVVGGDGTLLRTLMRLGNPESVVMGVRAGKRGFLLDVEQYEVEARVRDFVEGRYVVVEHGRLQPLVFDREHRCALNDVVMVGKNAKMVRLSVYLDGEKALNIDGDGVIVATTLGSTAYSLSAGGPIIDPRLDAAVITPLNPIQLHLRPLVVPTSYTIEIEVSPGSNDLSIVIDGQEYYDLGVGDVVSIRRCPWPARIARFRWWEGFYERLYARLLSYW